MFDVENLKISRNYKLWIITYGHYSGYMKEAKIATLNI